MDLDLKDIFELSDWLCVKIDVDQALDILDRLGELEDDIIWDALMDARDHKRVPEFWY